MVLHSDMKSSPALRVVEPDFPVVITINKVNHPELRKIIESFHKAELDSKQIIKNVMIMFLFYFHAFSFYYIFLISTFICANTMHLFCIFNEFYF